MRNKVIVIVGDVHDDWNSQLDERALRFLNPDLVLFTGGFGDENLEVVRDVSRLSLPKLVIMGNHDCCYSTQGSSGSANKKNSNVSKKWGRVNQQLEALGKCHVGYNRKDFPQMKMSVVGLRPFASSGLQIYNEQLIEHLYGVKNMNESVQKIMEQVRSAPNNHSLIFLGHNGPRGLGSQPGDICGNDYQQGGGDSGNPDTETVLQECRKMGLNVPSVVFGHMHRDLRGHMHRTAKRKMCVVENRTVYVNAAIVPRCQENNRNFTVVELSPDGSSVISVSEKWITVEAQGEPKLHSDMILYSRTTHRQDKTKCKS